MASVVPVRKIFGTPLVEVRVLKGHLINWVKFAWANIMQVEGFIPKLRAIGRLIAFLRR